MGHTDHACGPLRRGMKWLLLLLIHLMVWGYVLKILFRPGDGWGFYFAFISMSILLLAMIFTRGWFRIISAVFLLGGLMMLWQTQVPPTDGWRFFGSTSGILALLIVAPFFSIPISLGAYHRSALLIVRERVRRPHGTYFVITAFTYLLATLMNVAAIVASYTTLHHLTRSFPKATAEKMNEAAYCRGHCLAMIWSPVALALGVALDRVPADPGKVLALGLAFSMFMVFVDAWLMKKWMDRHAEAFHPSPMAEGDHRVSAKHWRRMGVFCAVIVVFVAGVIGLHELFSFAVIDAVILLILLFSLFWTLCLKKPNRLLRELRIKCTDGIFGLLPQIMLFISVGFFTQVMTAGGFLEPLAKLAALTSDAWRWLLVLFVIMLAAIGSQIGIFPALTVMLLTDLIPYEAIHLRPEWFVFAIIAGAVCGVPASPLTVNVNVVAALMGKDPRLIARSNLNFAVTMLLMIAGVTLLLAMLFPA